MEMITRALGTGKLLLAKHLPTILTGGGIIVIGIGIYMFCKASMEVREVIDEHDECMEEIRENKENLTAKEVNREIFEERRVFAMDMIKLYGPAVTTTLLGMTMILGGHYIISKRFTAISTAYKALEEGYSKYRKRVREDLGEEADRKYLYGMKNEKVDVTTTDENGEQKTETKDIMTIPRGMKPVSPYARFFDEFSQQWTRNPEYNLMFLKAQQNYANDKLHATGHLFLNEVYEMLGLPHTTAGSVVGWVLNKGGDNFVDFGIYDQNDEAKRAFVNGYEPSILLDFNVQGVIYNLI